MKSYIVTYDINAAMDDSYEYFYAYLETRGQDAYIKLTESSYLIKSNLDLEKFTAKMERVFSRRDVVYVIAATEDGTLLIEKV